MNENKYCVNCKWFFGEGEQALCSHPKLLSLVTGRPKVHCSTERGGDNVTVYPCGKSGSLYEQAQTTP